MKTRRITLALSALTLAVLLGACAQQDAPSLPEVRNTATQDTAVSEDMPEVVITASRAETDRIG